MKNFVLAALLAIGIAGPAAAQSMDQIHNDRHDVAQQRHEVREDIRHGDGVAAYHDRREQKAAQLDLRHDQINRRQHIQARHIVAWKRQHRSWSNHHRYGGYHHYNRPHHHHNRWHRG